MSAALNSGGREMVIARGNATFNLTARGQFLAAIKAGFARGEAEAAKVKAFRG